jgi:hypothetical protein
VLLGLLLGSVLGLWPFTRPLHPDLAHPAKRKAIEAVVVKGQAPQAALRASGVAWDEATLVARAAPYAGLGKATIKQLSGRTERVPVTPVQGAMALGLLALGATATLLLAQHGPRKS